VSEKAILKTEKIISVDGLAETLSFILINILLSGSLAVDLSNNIISKYLAPTPWTYLIVWFFISLITILIIQVVPKMYFRYKHKTLFRT